MTSERDAVYAPRAHVAGKVQRARTLVLVQGEYARVTFPRDAAHFVAL